MAVTVIRGTNQKPASSEALVGLLQQMDHWVGQLYVGYPILGSSDGRLPLDALLVSPTMGVVIFDLVEGHGLDDYESRQDDAANKLEAKLRGHRELVDRRELIVPLHPVTFAPGLSSADNRGTDDYPILNSSSIIAFLQRLNWRTADPDAYHKVLSALQNISTIRHSRSRRVLTKTESRGAKLKKLEDSIATLDNMQSRAVIETVEGVQRIRGLAGSGKTIVLALKAAYLHAQHPDWRIAVTFNTRSLKAQFKRFINTFCIAQTGEEPDWDQIRVVNAWGAPGGPARDGIYYEFCRIHGIPYYDYSAAKTAFGKGNEFKSVCKQALDSARATKPAYDAILVDEAQDFPTDFLLLCYELLGDNKHLVYAYDELQNLQGESVPPPEVIFGTKSDGSPKVRLDEPTPSGARRDIILHVCYRNSRPVLASAHSLGFGVYRTPPKGSALGLVQMFDYPRLWEDIGYHVEDGLLEPGEIVTLERTPDSSPAFLENHSTIDDLIQFITFNNAGEQVEWLVQEIKRNLDEDELRADDIVVINPNPITTRDQAGPIRARLLEMGIDSHIAGVTTDPDVFFVPESNSITFTGIYRAKGNEAGMIYIINAQDCHAASYNLASIRNRLFTAMTRSKAWVRVLGVGEAMTHLKAEFDRVRAANFKLTFRYPTEDERKHLAIVHRDVTPETRKTIQAGQKSLGSLLKDIEAGSVHLEDLDPKLVTRLRSLLDGVDER